MVEPARHLADEAARAGRPVWHYRFSYVAESEHGELMGAPHGSKIPFTFNSAGWEKLDSGKVKELL